MNMQEILQAHYPSNAYCLLKEVRNGAGFDADRSADWIAISTWPSRGLHIHGIEQKVSRADWLKELKQPAKADAFFHYCHYWWLLTSDESIVKEGELPDGWGWKCVRNGKITIKKEAKFLNPVALPFGIIVSMLKRASDRSEYTLSSSIQDKIKAEYDRGFKSCEASYLRRKDPAIENAKIIEDFKKETGLDLKGWRGGKDLYAAIKYVHENGINQVVRDIERIKGICRSINDSADKFLSEIQIQRGGKGE